MERCSPIKMGNPLLAMPPTQMMRHQTSTKNVEKCNVPERQMLSARFDGVVTKATQPHEKIKNVQPHFLLPAGAQECIIQQLRLSSGQGLHLFLFSACHSKKDSWACKRCIKLVCRQGKWAWKEMLTVVHHYALCGNQAVHIGAPSEVVVTAHSYFYVWISNKVTTSAPHKRTRNNLLFRLIWATQQHVRNVASAAKRRTSHYILSNGLGRDVASSAMAGIFKFKNWTTF